MKFKKNFILLSIILLIGSAAYFLIPSFEREEFNSEIVEDISSGNITTTTSQETEENENSQPEKQEEELEEDLCNKQGFWTWMLKHCTCPLEAGPLAQLHFELEIVIVSGPGCWSIGLVLLKLGLRPSFIFNKKS